jgi:hypothetical protein
MKIRMRCINNWGYEVSLIEGKIYEAEQIDKFWVRVVDESGEDYMFSKNRFEKVKDNE